MKTITVAHSPDADDIFMYYAIKFGWVSLRDFMFENIALDIETLNEKALQGIYDISAISFALYPKIKDNFALLKTAVSFGEGYGPKLVKKRDKRLKRNFKVALSGKNTTNAMLFRLYYPQAKVIYKNFLDIEKAVLEDEVDAGVLIHESILNYSGKLIVEKELWDIWQELAKDELPLPLGGMVIRRSMPLLRACECENILIDAVKIAESNKKQLSQMLIERDLVRVDEKELEKYLNLYANKNSIVLNEIQLKSINRLFEIGFEGGFYDQLIDVHDYLIPQEYERLRKG